MRGGEGGGRGDGGGEGGEGGGGRGGGGRGGGIGGWWLPIEKCFFFLRTIQNSKPRKKHLRPPKPKPCSCFRAKGCTQIITAFWRSSVKEDSLHALAGGNGLRVYRPQACKAQSSQPMISQSIHVIYICCLTEDEGCIATSTS